ncbi:hypothetical protein BS78_10G258200 [Paspalum vaginatum]|nr:hypothetical protein BS78_10G258200 [Paspalum vaginatum]
MHVGTRSSPLITNQTEVLLPDVSLTTTGGALFPVSGHPAVASSVTAWRSPRVTSASTSSARTSWPGSKSSSTARDPSWDGRSSTARRSQQVLDFSGYKNVMVADAPDGSPSPLPADGPTKLTPHAAAERWQQQVPRRRRGGPAGLGRPAQRRLRALADALAAAGRSTCLNARHCSISIQSSGLIRMCI